MIIIFSDKDVIQDHDWNYIPKQSAWWLHALMCSDWAAVIDKLDFIIIKSRNHETSLLLEKIPSTYWLRCVNNFNNY